jgi:hypothetical protein
MTIGSISIILILGIINFILVLFQLASGMHFIKVPFGLHKNSGIVLFFTAIIHGALAILVS